jgi:tetratricopeptide (TPR) repeat protein
MSVNNLANMLSDLGRREEALAQAEEAVRIYRQLAEARPEAFLPDLGMSVNNLANRLSDLGRREEALAQAEGAVRIYRQLAEARPEAFLPDLAGSLGVRGSVLREEQPGSAMASFSEAIRLLTPAFSRYPQAFAGLMRWIRGEYLEAAQAAGADLDEGLLAPVNAVFEAMGSV